MALQRGDGGPPDLFDAPSYADWVRGAMRLKLSRPEIRFLFENTIPEPTAQISAVIAGAFSGDLTSRWVSVFADGNRFAVEALARRYGLAPENIIPTTGVTGGLALLLKALVRPGDEVLVETPGFDLLGRLAREAGARVGAFSRPAPTFDVDLEQLADRLTPRTRAVILTNQHNPSGAWLPPARIAEVGELVSRVGAVLIVDEVYADFVAHGGPPAGALGPNIVTLSSLTKVFGLFALKFGWMAAGAPLIQRIRAAAPDGDTGVSKLTHAVGAHVMEAPARFEAHWRGVLAASRPVAARHVAALQAEGRLAGHFPEHGCMYFPAVPGVGDTAGLCRTLLAEHDVLVAPGEYFGAPGHIRIGFGATPDAVDAAFVRLAAGLRAIG